MIKKSMLVLVCSLVLISGMGGVGFCTDDYSDFTCPVEVRRYESIPYITGGVGLNERRALERIGRDYNLKLVFAVTGGSYLGEVQVSIKDMAGRVILETVSDGPWFFTDLPTGKYSVTAQVDGQGQRKVFRVSQRRQKTVSFFWR
jgi:hypothetical protein